jgi:hypothetical protein
MRFSKEKEIAKKKPEWQRWFAWHPVTIETQNNLKTTVWLEYVERKGTIGYNCMEYRYRDIITNDNKEVI